MTVILPQPESVEALENPPPESPGLLHINALGSSEPFGAPSVCPRRCGLDRVAELWVVPLGVECHNLHIINILC